MVFCRDCGTKLIRNGKFCHSCGMKLDGTPVPGDVKSLSFDEFKKKKESERQSKFKKANTKDTKRTAAQKSTNEVAKVQVGLVASSPDSDHLKKVKGRTIPVLVDTHADASTLLHTAVEKHGRHFKQFNKFFDYVLLYPDMSVVQNLPACIAPFTVEKYKRDLLKPYSKIFFWQSSTSSTSFHQCPTCLDLFPQSEIMLHADACAEAWVDPIGDPDEVDDASPNKIAACKTNGELGALLCEDSMMDILQMVGYRGVPSKETLSSVPEIQRSFVITGIARTLTCIDQMITGLASFGALDYIRSHKNVMKPLFTLDGARHFQPTPELFIEGLNVLFSEEGSNHKACEKDVFKNFCEFVQDLDTTQGSVGEKVVEKSFNILDALDAIIVVISVSPLLVVAVAVTSEARDVVGVDDDETIINK
ncbi:hypothetical protein AWC38_SpisGene10459 [Stylophora pistillata]|uniref:Zinc-ribbon domain-containing protein n=1 Tax=Stylophora pistillata TaxID=50429 RepID=A0A2B4S8K3_STYPI|nr:hypothetical protein AWC38_SpisGene10459 [Stylophora pistillata]